MMKDPAGYFLPPASNGSSAAANARSFSLKRSEIIWLSALFATRNTAPVPLTPPGATTVSPVMSVIGAFSSDASVTRTVFTLCSAPSVQPVSS